MNLYTSTRPGRIKDREGEIMTFIDLFAGIGGFRRGMEQAGHKCIGFCEWDKFAAASYTAMHLMTAEEREYIGTLPFKKRYKEAIKEEYRHGEWYADDIRRVFAGDIPRADCWCFGFPCQDISVAGKQTGLAGNRSGLFHTVIKLLEDTQEKDRPSVLFIENVKNLLSVNRGYDFLTVLTELDKIGYDAEWQVINSAGYAAQNRERVFIIGHLRGRSTGKVFPIEGTDGENKILQIGMKKSKRGNPNTYRVYSIQGLNPALGATQGGIRMPCILVKNRVRKTTPLEYFRLQGWEDEYFNRAAIVNSDSQLYKQAGNGVTVPVIYDIARRL